MSAADEPEIRIERYAILRNHVIIQWTDEHGEARGQTVAVRAAVFDNAHRDMTEPPRMTLPMSDFTRAEWERLKRLGDLAWDAWERESLGGGR